MSEWMALMDINSVAIGLLGGLLLGLVFAIIWSRAVARKAAETEIERLQPLNTALEERISTLEESLQTRVQALTAVQHSLAVAETRLEEQQQHHKAEKASLEEAEKLGVDVVVLDHHQMGTKMPPCLALVNPNRQELDIEGISYTISLLGHDFVKGVGKDFPVIEGYGTGILSLQAHTNLLAGIQLVREMISKDRPEKMTYEFKGKIDLGAYHRALRFSEQGDFSMTGKGQETGEFQPTDFRPGE